MRRRGDRNIGRLNDDLSDLSEKASAGLARINSGVTKFDDL
jgi:hypothetical protein